MSTLNNIITCILITCQPCSSVSIDYFEQVGNTSWVQLIVDEPFRKNNLSSSTTSSNNCATNTDDKKCNKMSALFLALVFAFRFYPPWQDFDISTPF